MSSLTTAASTTPLFFYLLTNPVVDVPAALITFSLWVASMSADLYVTLANGRYIRYHEQSVILSSIHARFQHSPRTAAAVMIAIEAACVLLLPVLAIHHIDMGASMGVAHLFSTLHAHAVVSNERFVRDNPHGGM